MRPPHHPFGANLRDRATAVSNAGLRSTNMGRRCSPPPGLPTGSSRRGSWPASSARSTTAASAPITICWLTSCGWLGRRSTRRSSSGQEQHGRPEQSGGDRPGEDADLRLSLEPRGVVGQARDEQRDREADPRQRGRPPHSPGVTPAGSTPTRVRTPAWIARPTPTSLPSTSPAATAQVKAAGQGGGQRTAAEVDARVGEREERNHHERRQRLQPVLEVPGQRRPPTSPVGVRRPSTTPATVACTPDSSVATHSATPTKHRCTRA